MASLRVTFSSVRDRVQSVGSPQGTPAQKRLNLTPGAEIVTYLPLQVLLYFNVFYSPLWFIACVLTLENKVAIDESTTVVSLAGDGNGIHDLIWLLEECGEQMLARMWAGYDRLATHYKFVTVTVYIVMFLVETARLFLGYEGNLREKVPELAGFWILSLLQTPLTVYLLANVDTVVLPLERAVNIPLLAFLLAQLPCGLRALQLMVRAQAVKFHLSQFDSLLPEENIEMHEL